MIVHTIEATAIRIRMGRNSASIGLRIPLTLASAVNWVHAP
jgi:hypothetical protein